MSFPTPLLELLIPFLFLVLEKCKIICAPTVLMPVIYGALEVPNPKVQHKALKIIPTILDVIDYATVKTALFQKLEVFFFNLPEPKKILLSFFFSHVA